ncbi:MAG: ImmA/IrrE family metallo-endopeptidase [Sulfurimonas sp.]|nr:ImmA/IrrE family metallo-endopeptidase [Sulfurimonas sp.]
MEKYEAFKNKKISAEELHAILHKANNPFPYPVNIDNLIKFLNIQIEVKPDFTKMKVLGSISIKNNKPIIWVNKIANQMEERRRFTLAHELGHFMLHIAPLSSWDNKTFEDPEIGFNRDDKWDYQEMEANNFAAQLLIPEDALNVEYQKIHNLDTATKIDKLSKIFNVSKIAMKYRLESVGLLR